MFENFMPPQEPERPTKPKEIKPALEQDKQLERNEIVADSQIERAGFLKKVLFSRTTDIAGNYVPGLDFLKMAAEGAIGQTISRRELPPVERICFVLSAALIAGFYLTGDFRLRLGASAVFDAIMAPQILGEVLKKVAEIIPGVQPILESAGGFLANSEGARRVFEKVFGTVLQSMPI